MGRGDYLVQAGVGFDIDRSGARKSIGVFESLAQTLNGIAAKETAKGFEKTEKAYNSSMKEIEKTNKDADKALTEGTKASAQAAQKALKASMPKELTAKQRKRHRDKGTLKKYNDEMRAELRGMKTSYAKFIDESQKIGIKVRKAKGGFGTGQSVTDFKDKDVEQRKQLINLTKRMADEEKKKLKLQAKGSKHYLTTEGRMKALNAQARDMGNMNEDLIQQEKKKAKIQQKTARAERKAEKKRAKEQKAHIGRLKTINRGLQKMGQVASQSAGKIKSGLQNAFVIGTAAAGAMFYKMQPLVESVMEFEKTIVNANSVFNVTAKELHSVSDEMVKFTMKYGVSAQETATGLYQLASAGLSASESQEVLQHTMKLAMATQGDHNTLAKLTTQTIMGFGMEMSDAEELTDKFAHSIQKSLIEWQDLASSVKFAMPFFVATGQSIDELLGGLEVLTNRALEAGIAGRGLRQALAQFAKHASDNESAFAKMGISILDAEGNMKALSAIALEAKAAFGDVTDLEALTAMLEDMNVRGATAFALLVQNADEFDSAVKNVAQSAGEATQMADIQQQSLAMQIQRVKNALLAPFLLSDPIGEANDTLNTFTLRVKELVDEFTEFFIIIGPDGQETYSEHGAALKEFVIAVLDQAVIVIKKLKDVFLEQEEGFTTLTTMMEWSVKPLMLFLEILDRMHPSVLKWYVAIKMITAILPLSNAMFAISNMLQTKALLAMQYGVGIRAISLKQMLIELGYMKGKTLEEIKAAAAKQADTVATESNTVATLRNNMAKRRESLDNMMKITTTEAATASTAKNTAGNYANAASMAIMAMKALAFIYVAKKLMDLLGPLGAAIAGIAALHFLAGIPKTYDAFLDMKLDPLTAAAMTGATMVGLAAMIWGLYSTFASTAKAEAGVSANAMAPLKFNKERNYDGGGTYLPVYDNGGFSTEHGTAILQKGETVVPKTQNMLGAGGITLNMGDVNVQDGEDFAERVAVALPEALRRQNDMGAI